MSLPSDVEKRKRISADLERGINLLNEIDMLQSSIEDLSNTLQDEDVCKAKNFKEWLKVKYEGQQLLEKANKKVSDVEAAIAEVDVLSKVK